MSAIRTTATSTTGHEEAVNPFQCDTVLSLSLLAVILPPVAVGVLRGWFGESFWISVILTILGYIPGVCYAFFCIFTDPALKRRSDERRQERAALTPTPNAGVTSNAAVPTNASVL